MKFADSGPTERLVQLVPSPFALCCWGFRFNFIVVDTGNASCVVDVRWRKKQTIIVATNEPV